MADEEAMRLYRKLRRAKRELKKRGEDPQKMAQVKKAIRWLKREHGQMY